MIDYGESDDLSFLCFTDVEVRFHRAFENLRMEADVKNIFIASIDGRTPAPGDFPAPFQKGLQFLSGGALYFNAPLQDFVNALEKIPRKECYFIDREDAGSALNAIKPVKRPVQYTFFGHHSVGRAMKTNIAQARPFLYLNGDPSETVVIIKDIRRAKRFIDYYAVKYQIHRF